MIAQLIETERGRDFVMVMIGYYAFSYPPTCLSVAGCTKGSGICTLSARTAVGVSPLGNFLADDGYT